MDKLQIPSPSNGYPFNWEDIEFTLGLGAYDSGLIQSIEAILAVNGDNYIVSGCEVSGSDISEGWILLDGELIKVDAHTATDDYFEKVESYNSDGSKQTQTGSTEDAYLEVRATATASSGNLESPVSGSPDVKTGTKTIEMGDRQLDVFFKIDHGLDVDKIIGCRILVIADWSGGEPGDKFPIESVDTDNPIVIIIDDTSIGFYPSGGGYDDFDASIPNRGYIIIDYLP